MSNNTPSNPPQTAKQALIELVTWALRNRFCSTAATIRSLLLSLYSGDNKTDLSAVQLLDTRQRRELVTVIMGIGRGDGFWDYEIRDVFAIIGKEPGLVWFFEPTGGCEEDLIADFMRTARKAVAA